MKRVLVVIGALRTGGAEKITLDFITNMDRSNLQVYFLVFGKEIGEYEIIAKKIGCEVIHIQVPRPPYGVYYKELDRVLKEYGPFDVLHTHMLLNNGITCRYACKKNIRKRISHSHSTNSNRVGGVVSFIYEKVMKSMIKKYATDYLACGQAAGEYLYGKKLFEEKGQIICNGVNFEKNMPNDDLRCQVRKKLNVENMFVIGHVARIEDVKNHEFALEIIKELKDRGKDIVYMIVGEGSQRFEVEKKVKKLSIQENVKILGNRDDVFEIQNAFDMVLYPSKYEGLPVALVEAQINLIPCIVSGNVSKEVKLSKHLHFVDLNESVKFWADKVEMMMKRSREDNKLLDVAKQYNIKVSSEKLKQIYEA